MNEPAGTPETAPDLPDPATIIGEPIADHPARLEPVAAERPQTVRNLAIGAIVGFLILAAGEAWLFSAQSGKSDDQAQVSQMADQISGQAQDIATLKSRVASLDDKVTALANRPPPQPAAALAPPPPQIPAALDQKISALQASIANLSTTTLADHAAVAGMQTKQADLPKLVAQAKTLALVAQASLALQNGAPLGAIPGAPEALVRYQTDAPPTLAALRAAFPAYARQAATAGGEVAAHGGFWRDIKGRVESLVTIRHNADVLVGSRAAGMLGAAQSALDHDDLAKAVADLKPLPSKAQAIMAPWTTEAANLLAARAALATMAGQS